MPSKRGKYKKHGNKTCTTYRGTSYRMPNNRVMCLYGRLRDKGRCVAYCSYHKCYLEPMDITERKCNAKHCNHLRELGKFKDIEGGE